METSKGDFFQDTYKLLTDYVDDRVLLLKIQAAEKTGKLAAALIKLMVVGLIFFFIVLFFSVVGALYFSELLGSYLFGFGMMLAIYVLLLLIYLLLNRYIFSKKIMNSVIQVFFAPSKVEQDLNHDEYE
jgi:hypothetical protein